MKHTTAYILFSLFSVLPCFLKAQTTADTTQKTYAFVSDEMPEYPGGETALAKFLKSNIQYPPTALAKKIKGRVMLKFFVMPDGSVNNIEVVRGLDADIDAEAVRVCRLLHFKEMKWPNPVKVQMILPIFFNPD